MILEEDVYIYKYVDEKMTAVEWVRLSYLDMRTTNLCHFICLISCPAPARVTFTHTWDCAVTSP